MSDPSMPLPCDLDGLGILVTRAEHQAEGLCRQIREHGGRALRFPAVEIGGPADPRQTAKILDHIADYQMALFISPNAVVGALELLGTDGLPEGLKIGAVGRSTANTLARAGYAVDIVPDDGFDSEALLATEELQEISGNQIVIFRGKGGRALLGEGLEARGARVDYAEVYQRLCPDKDPTLLLNRWADVDLVTATSNQVLDNLCTLLGDAGRKRLLEAPLLVISERMREHARALGFSQVILARGADDRSMLKAICNWQGHRV
ncbi:MAG: uroporphyrinogen-III synthase [Sedimenticola sp.]